MKKFLSAFLAIAFLLPAFASAADSYCVSFPKSGDSKFTKRDNSIQVRFRYAYIDDTDTIHHGQESYFESTSGVRDGQNRDDNIVFRDKVYTPYPYGAGRLCIYNPMPKAIKNIEVRHVRLDVKWGGDCQKVAIKNGRFAGTHRFEIYHRKGDLVNPFGCRRK